MSYYYLNLFKYHITSIDPSFRMNDVYLLCLCHLSTRNLKNRGGGGGSGLDYVILLSQGGWVLITVDYGGGKGGKNFKNDYAIYIYILEKNNSLDFSTVASFTTNLRDHLTMKLVETYH